MEASLPLLTTDYPELLEHIASFLPAPHVSFGLRPVCKATAALFDVPRYQVVRLSQSCPAFAFQDRWGCSSDFAQLKLSQRQEMLSLVAASGSVENMECVMAHAPDCWSTAAVTSAARAGHHDVLQSMAAKGAVIDKHALDAAAGVGNLEMCQHLISAHDTCQPSSSTLKATAGGGHLHVVQWLLQEANCPWSTKAVYRAAAAGHAPMLAWLLQQPQLRGDTDPQTWDLVLENAAAGCDLATFRQLLQEQWPPGPHTTADTTAAAGVLRYIPPQHVWQSMVQEAAGSCTPDWQAKVELLLQEPPNELWPELDWATYRAAMRPDAEARLRWLHAQGMPIDSALCPVCQDPGASMGAVRLALMHGMAFLGTWDTDGACRTGRVDVLDALHAAGCPFADCALLTAAGAGHLPAVQWLREHLPAEQRRLTGEVFAAAAGSGNLSLLCWLSLQEDAVVCPQAYNAAAAAGSVEVIQWLFAFGVPFPGNGAPYLAAARHGDVLALRTLVSLRCPWGRPGRVFARAIWARKGTVSMWHLQMLLSFGCPVVWCSALSAAKLRAEPEVEVWLRGLWEGGRRAAAKRRAGRLIFDL